MQSRISPDAQKLFRNCSALYFWQSNEFYSLLGGGSRWVGSVCEVIPCITNPPEIVSPPQKHSDYSSETEFWWNDGQFRDFQSLKASILLATYANPSAMLEITFTYVSKLAYFQ